MGMGMGMGGSSDATRRIHIPFDFGDTSVTYASGTKAVPPTAADGKILNLKPLKGSFNYNIRKAKLSGA